MFLIHIDRTILDSFSHADIGPKATKAGYMILEAEKELEQAVPNLTMKYEEGLTDDEFALAAVDCALHSAKPSFANHKMFKKELTEDYVIASCYNGLRVGGGSYTLSRLILGNIAKRAENIKDFKENQLPYVMDIMARYMDERIRFEVEESGFFTSNFLAKEGFIHRDRFTAMYGLVGLADAVNILLEKEGKTGRFGHDEYANDLGVEIMDMIDEFNRNHKNIYCEVTDHHFLLHAQVGIAEDIEVTPGTRIPIGEEPEELIDHLLVLSRFHKYFPSGTGDIFPIDLTVHRNPEYVLDIVKGSFAKDYDDIQKFGKRVEGFVHIFGLPEGIKINLDEDNLDELNYLKGKTLDYVNSKAMQGVIDAHVEGNVPNIVINMEKLDEETIGHLIYFFELACAMSGKLLGVNPFDQPGVEKYKTNMFKLLGKPGYNKK